MLEEDTINSRCIYLAILQCCIDSKQLRKFFLKTLENIPAEKNDRILPKTPLNTRNVMVLMGIALPCLEKPIETTKKGVMV